jgi:hypothetical protein
MECKRQPSRMKKKGMFKKAKKRENFKAKKSAYLQVKAAYHACMFDTTDEEEVSSHDDDEDSNKSFSDYSSEGSNAS